MWDFLSQHLKEIGSFIVGAISGSLLTFTITRKSASKGGSVIDQSGSKVGRDQIGSKR